MRQKVKIIERYNVEDLETAINEFLGDFEIKSIQLVTTPVPEYVDVDVVYTALIKYVVFA